MDTSDAVKVLTRRVEELYSEYDRIFNLDMWARNKRCKAFLEFHANKKIDLDIIKDKMDQNKKIIEILKTLDENTQNNNHPHKGEQ